MAAYLQIRNVTKVFHGVSVLKNVSLDINAGEIHVIIGENGAGKSTLMKIVAGLYRPEEGQIFLEGEKLHLNSPQDAIAHHISMIHQELTPEPYLNVAENVFLGREARGTLGLLNKKRQIEETQKLFDQMKVDINPRAEIRTLSMAQKQLVEIAKAVSYHSRVLIMDEPTSALSDREINYLYDLIFRLKADGVAVIFISHKLDEIFRVADRITVLRDGELITTQAAAEMSANKLIALMVGRDIVNIYDKQRVPLGEPVLEVQHLTKKGLFEDITFTLHRNEILGIAGLVGAGRTELLETIFGLRKADSGQVLLHGKAARIRNTHDARQTGLALVPESRGERGLNLGDTVGFNASICSLSDLSKPLFLNKRQEIGKIDRIIDRMNVKPADRNWGIRALSGGNQQKVVIGKWLMRDSEIILLDEPTRGIDVGAKAEIYRLMTQLVKEGKSILMVSSELPEVIGMSDRVLVLCEGKLTGELTGEKINQQEIMRCATNQVAE